MTLYIAAVDDGFGGDGGADGEHDGRTAASGSGTEDGPTSPPGSPPAGGPAPLTWPPHPARRCTGRNCAPPAPTSKSLPA
ncbi:hypothetical protein ACR6C2_03725 [Streptomyces sp. INA 01156]